MSITSARLDRYNAALKRKAQTTLLFSDASLIKIEFQFHNKPSEVTSIRCYANTEYPYPVCPTCGYAMEREYQRHCEQCGQFLSWNKFSMCDVTVQRCYGHQKKE